MIPTKQSSHYNQASPPAATNRGSPMYSPPYEASPSYPHKRNTSSRRSSTGTSRQGSVEMDRTADEDSNTPTTSQSNSTTFVTPQQLEQQQTSTAITSSQQDTSTAALDGANDKDDVDPDEDDKDELVMDDDMHAQMEKAKEDMKYLLENFTDEQLQRYEAYRRSALNRTNVKRVILLNMFGNGTNCAF
ncbi:unnamed protein product [Absidia cylindrospora]